MKKISKKLMYSFGDMSSINNSSLQCYSFQTPAESIYLQYIFKQMNKVIKNATIQSVQTGKLLSVHFLLNVISNIPFL